MPYIPQSTRELLCHDRPYNTGELNYVISKAINDYLSQKTFNYEALNEVIGALECAKLEIYRRLVAPYEDRKKLANGDVFDLE